MLIDAGMVGKGLGNTYSFINSESNTQYISNIVKYAGIETGTGIEKVSGDGKQTNMSRFTRGGADASYFSKIKMVIKEKSGINNTCVLTYFGDGDGEGDMGVYNVIKNTITNYFIHKIYEPNITIEDLLNISMLDNDNSEIETQTQDGSHRVRKGGGNGGKRGRTNSMDDISLFSNIMIEMMSGGRARRDIGMLLAHSFKRGSKIF
jgi:hypothetical protein